MTDDVRSRVLLTPKQLKSMMDRGDDLIILAVQSVNPYTGTDSIRDRRIPGAIDTEAYEDFQAPASPEGGARPLPAIDVLEAKAKRWGLRPEATVVVYDSDRSMVAARAWWVLRWAGLNDVRVLDGGMPAWIKDGMPIETAHQAVKASDIALSPGHMPELDAEATAAMARNGVLLDARIRPNYVGGPTPAGAPARGHIPGAISTPAPDNLTDYGTFADQDALAGIYQAVGADGTKPVGAYCGAGMSAAHTVLALAALGVDAALYVGSWSQWASDPTRPVARGGLPG
ncbi:thiosulfate/3-mercaptopyruvate sulfurtransferase [Devosia crocina]|uniref:Thiosulfate/3-mercaptopyruvate sulfurtransferase n=1 Tax=Devosia crocina TaxID=429728 RepID=A0A1I7MXV5_9HYPH|nr:rhodanese-like domain-containing protein [Devosia crocina]SFV27175.1 thiosulfate/3-mercaptopyruvate sulfurtransferase [Devosia crocina]